MGLLFEQVPRQRTKFRIVPTRIAQHAKDESKDFFQRALLFTSKDQNLTKAHVRYLESRLIEMVGDAGRANLANGTEPGAKRLPESDIADMEFFLSQVQVILPVVGVDVLRPKPKSSSIIAAASAIEAPSGSVELTLESRKHGLKAHAIEQDGEITVLKGSTAVAADTDFAHNTYRALREQLLKEARLVPAADPKFLEFAEDMTFKSPSAAGAVIFGRNTNGRTAWKVAATGQTLKDWQDSQLDAIESPGE